VALFVRTAAQELAVIDFIHALDWHAASDVQLMQLASNTGHRYLKQLLNDNSIAGAADI
jgi:hypothetical protein